MNANANPPASAENPLPLATLNDKGKPPKQRLSSAADAQSLYWSLHEASLSRLNAARVIQGNFDGNPPYNPAKMRQSGNAFRPNFNTLEGASRLEAAKVPYYDLISSVPQYADCVTEISTDTVDAGTASMVRTAAFDKMLRSFEDFDDEFWTLFNDFLAFNRGFLWFPRPDSWHFERLPWHKVLFPDGTSTKTSRWELFAIKHEWPVHKLYAFVKDEAAAKAAGWNPKQVWRAIQQAAPEEIANAYRDPMALQQAFRDSELTMTARIGTVQAASIYTREFDGTWSRMMVQTQQGTENMMSGPTSAAERSAKFNKQHDPSNVYADVHDSDWLYNKREVGKSVYEILCPFIFETGDGSINELAGLGKKIIAANQATDRLVNEAVGSAMMQSSIVLQQVSGVAQAKQAIIQFGGPVTTVPAGYTIQPGTIWANLEAPLAVLQEMRNRMDVNTGTYRPAFEKPPGNPESATGAQIRFTQGTVLSSAAVNRFSRQLDRFWSEVYRRASMSLPKTSSDPGIKAAIEFQKECEKEGLSEKQIEDHGPGMIRAVRAIGNGSPMMRQQIVGALAQYVPYMGPRGMEAWLTDSLAAWGGIQAVKRYRPAEDRHDEPTHAMREATSENNDFQTGAQVLFLDSDDHEQHAKVHLTAAAAAIQSVQQGADPAMAFTFLQMVMPHTGQHIAKVARKQMRDSLENAYKIIAQQAEKVSEAAQQAVENQGQQQQLSFEQQMAMQKTQSDIQRSDFKMKETLRIREERQKAELDMANRRATQEAALADAQTASAIQRTTSQTITDIELSKAKTEHELIANRLLTQAKITTAKASEKNSKSK